MSILRFEACKSGGRDYKKGSVPSVVVLRLCLNIIRVSNACDKVFLAFHGLHISLRSFGGAVSRWQSLS
jgi:hypothetical protein